MGTDIHPSAIVDKEAQIADNVKIGPFCIIGKDVVIKSNTSIQSNVIIERGTEIGEKCEIYPFVSIGLPPQDLKYDGRKTGVKIGEKNIIREYTTIHRASIGGDGLTEIGSNNFLMAYVHVAHDCKVGSHVIMANVATLAGHVEVEDYTAIGGLVAIHQFTKIGSYSMVGGFSGVGQDIPPFMLASGPRAQLYGLNLVGLKRHGFSEDIIRDLKKAYKILFRDKLSLNEAIEKVESEFPDSKEIKILLNFISNNKRGICRKV